MSKSRKSRVFLADEGDPEMARAYERARATFRYFWREIAWERRRIVPALDLACVKAPFSDGEAVGKSDRPQVEHMWVSEVDFDGEAVGGELVNAPNWLKTVEQGDAARFAVDQISDWMFAISGKVYGAFTVNLLRSRMGDAERKQHDAAWGLDFGDPSNVRIPADEEHPMSVNMAASLRGHLKQHPEAVSETGHNGWTLLHQDASAGSVATVEVLLEAGADPTAKAENGLTPVQLAQTLGWEAVVALLTRKRS